MSAKQYEITCVDSSIGIYALQLTLAKLPFILSTKFHAHSLHISSYTNSPPYSPPKSAYTVSTGLERIVMYHETIVEGWFHKVHAILMKIHLPTKWKWTSSKSQQRQIINLHCILNDGPTNGNGISIIGEKITKPLTCIVFLSLGYLQEGSWSISSQILGSPGVSCDDKLCEVVVTFSKAWAKFGVEVV